MSHMNDQEKLRAMRTLGVRWPQRDALPTYPRTMTDDQKRQADALYDSLSQGFVDRFGRKQA